MNKKCLIVATVFLATLPLLASALVIPNPPSGLTVPTPSLIIAGLLNFAWPFVVGIIILIFIIIGFMFLTARGDEAVIAKARQALIWATVGIVVILLAFSVILIVQNTLGII